MGDLVISLLGAFQVTRDSTHVTDFESNKVRALLAYLAVESDRPHSRDALSSLLWPESAQENALNSLRNALANLRRAIGDHQANPPHLLITRESVQFNCHSDCRLDVTDILHQSDSAQDHLAAVQAYRGPFLQGFSIPDSAAFEEWVSLQREHLQKLTLEGLHWLADYYEGRGEYPAALEFARRQVALDAWLEESHCQVMRLLALSGQREQALRQYQTLRDTLKADLQAEPGQSAARLYQEILSGRLGAVPPKDHPSHNLPVQTTSFIGREKEIETLKRLVLSGQTRLVTVTGAGGTGKTRLALRAAEELLEAFPDGIWLVELGALADPGLVPAAVASALSLREAPDLPILQVLVDFLRSKRALLLLDTCEHLVGAVASLVDRILHTSPQVSILTTSREILGVSGEAPFQCPSLALPDPYFLPAHTETELAGCEAVRLFAERSALACPGFTLLENNVTMVAQVCRRLDGIPLAIELAAARTRMLSMEQIVERLEQSFHLLTGGSRTALPHQQTLKATIDWSYNLLAPAERTLLLRLSIFSGGWTLEAAEAVCSGMDSLPVEDILDVLGRLSDKSLILVETDQRGGRRYHMLDTIRQYAHDRLVETGGDSAVRGRRLDYFLRLAEQAEPHLRAWGMIEWMTRLETELGNLRLALDWSLSQGPVESGLRLASALFMFWHLRSHRLEGLQWLERLLAADQAGQVLAPLQTPSQKIVRGVALVVAHHFNHYYLGNVYSEHARLEKDEAQSIFRELGDLAMRHQPFALCYLTPSEQEAWDCLAMARKAGDEFIAAESICFLGNFLKSRGDFARAMAFEEENLAIRQKIGDKDGEAFAFYLLAELEYMQNNNNQAIELWEASQRCWQEVKNNEFLLYCSSFPAKIAFTRGDYLRVLQLSEAQLAAGQEISSSMVVAQALEYSGLAAWAMQADDLFERRCEEVLGPDWINGLPCSQGILFYACGRITLSRGEYARAAAYLSHFTNMVFSMKYLSIQALGILAAAQGQAKRAVVIFGAVDGLFGWLKNVASPVERSEYEQALETTRLALGSQGFKAAWAEGEAMTLEQALAFAAEGLPLRT